MLAVTLARRDLRENDQTITFYTKELGKVEAVARGVKKIIAKNNSVLEPLALLEVEIIPGKGVCYVGTVESVKIFKTIRQDLERLLEAESALAIVNMLIAGQEKDERIFTLIIDFLDYLNTAMPTKDSLDRFVLELLGYLGFLVPEASPRHGDILRHVRYYTGFPVVDWHHCQTWLS